MCRVTRRQLEVVILSCYRPNVVLYNEKQFGHFLGRLTEKTLNAKLIDGQELVQVPCGKCIGCRLDRSKGWADRMLLEYVTERDDMPSKQALFLTLTYDNEHVPIITMDDGLPGMNLVRKDFKDYMKRLRRWLDKSGRKARVFYAGEYGDHTFRPHFHAILFGLSMLDFPDAFVYSHDDKLGSDLYESPLLDRIWHNGAVRFAPANYQTFCYVARYVVKKINVSDGGDSFYKGRCPPFLGQSTKPALGADFFPTEFVDSKVYLPDGDDVHSVSVPRVVLLHLKEKDPEAYNALMATRRMIAASKTDMIKAQLGVPYLQYLRQTEQSFSQKSKFLRDRGDI